MAELKIAYILSTFPAFTETFIIREINEISRRGIDVIVFSLKNPDERMKSYGDYAQFYNNTIYTPYFLSLELWKSVFHYLWNQPGCTLNILTRIFKSNFNDPITFLKTIAIFPKSLAIAKRLKDSGITNIHAHWATVPATVAWIISRLNKSRYTFTTHAWDIFKADNLFEYKIQSAFKVITISRFNKHYIENKLPNIMPDKILIIHIGLDLNKFRPVHKAAGKIFRLISIGRLVKTKGFQFLLEACHLLREKNLPLRCQIIYVKDNYDKEIFNLYQNLKLEGTVDLIPEIPQEKITEYYGAADCFVLPCIVGSDGDRDGIPTVIMEALAMELPVISTSVSGIPEVIKDNVTGLLVEPGDSVALAEAIEKLYRNRELGVELGRNGRRLVSREFDISTNVTRLLETIQEEN